MASAEVHPGLGPCHTCLAVKCETLVPFPSLFCPVHWDLLHPQTQGLVRETHRPGEAPSAIFVIVLGMAKVELCLAERRCTENQAVQYVQEICDKDAWKRAPADDAFLARILPACFWDIPF